MTTCRAIVLCWAMVIVASSTPTAAANSCDEPLCILKEASSLLDEDRPRQALEILKEARADFPDDGRLVRMMALAYLDESSDNWALKGLLAHLDRNPHDLESRSWAVWILVRQGDVSRGRQVLDAAPPGGSDLLIARAELLEAAMANLNEERQTALAMIAAAVSHHRLFPEDRLLLDDLRRSVRGDAAKPFSLRLQLLGGFSSNAIMSSPTDPGAHGKSTGSPLVGIDAVVRFEPWASRWLRPVGEVRAKTLGQLAQESKDFSHSDLGSRVGLDVGDRGAHFSAAYSTEFLSVAGGDAYKSGPRAFMEAHRAELEFFPVSEVQAFLGFGRRIYRELPRTRTELDGGFATMVALKGGWNLTGVAAGRYYRARHIAFDGFGLTGLVRVVVPLPKEVMLKVRPMLVVDHYSKSASFYGSEVPRRDTMGKLRVGLWTPPLWGMRGGVTYSLSGRKSTISNYAYTDHRLLFELRWDGSWDPFAPRVLEPAEHIALPYEIGTEHESGLDRVQDLLRQEDSARRGSSCVD